MEHHADFAVSVSQGVEVEAAVGPDDGHGPLLGRVISLGWWVDSSVGSGLGHEPTGTLYLIVDDRRPRPYWVKQADLTSVRVLD